MGDGRLLILGALAALAFASGGTILIIAVQFWRAFLRAPESVLGKLLGPLLQGRAIYLCPDCQMAHMIPALPRDAEGAPDWKRSRASMVNESLESLAHEGMPLAVIGRRIAARSGLSFFGVVAALLTREERETTLAALRGEGQDDIADAIPREEHRNELERALEEWNAVEQSGFETGHDFPICMDDTDDVAAGRQPAGAAEIVAYVARLTPQERSNFALALDLAAGRDLDRSEEPVGDGLERGASHDCACNDAPNAVADNCLR